jgi:exodeoxyribonuclease V alpha subunit
VSAAASPGPAPEDAFAARIAFRAGASLARFNTAGVLDAADVQVARRLGALTGEADDSVLLAAALAVRAVRTGSVCARLDDLPDQPGDDLTDDQIDGASAGLVDVTARADRAVPDRAAPDAVPDHAARMDDAEPASGPPGAAAMTWPDPSAWQAAILASPMVAIGPDGPAERPVRWVDGRIYLDRYWRDEQIVREEVDGRLTGPLFEVDADQLRAAAHRFFPAERDSCQRLAAATTALSRFTVLTGGPGTGKTTTVARIVALLQAVDRPDLRVALAAPTGKAAARLQEAVNAEFARLKASAADAAGLDAAGPDDSESASPGAVARGAITGTALEATTIHRLLGWRRGSSTRFRHDRTHRLPHDVVVVDESSMVSLPLMARLLEALRPQTRLLLVGDPDQLASVEAGAVLGDLVARPPVADILPSRLAETLPGDLPGDPTAPTPTTDARQAPNTEGVHEALRNGVVRLNVSHRYGAELGSLAEAIRAGDDEEAVALLHRGVEAVTFVETAGDVPSAEETAGLRADVVRAGTALVTAATEGDVPAALEALNDHRLLLAHRRGAAGVAYWSARAEAWVTSATGADLGAPWQPGLPLMVTANDRVTGLSNGDTGVVVNDADGEAVVAFGDPVSPLLIRPHRLPAVDPVLAMTVHKAQGSQFRHVSVVLPAAGSTLLSRELLYTAITRARYKVRILGTEAAVRAAVRRPIRRASGLREPLR